MHGVTMKITVDCYELTGNLLDKFQCRFQMFTFIQTNRNVYNEKHTDRQTLPLSKGLKTESLIIRQFALLKCHATQKQTLKDVTTDTGKIKL